MEVVNTDTNQEFPPGAGGGGFIWSNPIAPSHPAATWNDALPKLQDARDKIINMSFSEGCKDILGTVGVTPAQIVQAAGAAQFLDALTSTETRASLYSNTSAAAAAASQYGRQTIQQWFLSESGVMAAADLSGFRIFFRPSGVDVGDLLFNSSLLMHELIHNITGLSDEVIKGKMGLYGATSDWISTQIYIKCFF
jgi:hypothetical protein